MCGRTSLFVDRADLEDRFDARVVADGGYRPRFNIAPGEPLEIITNDTPDEIDRYTWGLVPHWADEPGEAFVNARSETAHEKPAFQDAWASRPCLILSSGFYEWRQRNGGAKQPYRIYREDDVAFAMAGLWAEWEGENDESFRTVTILTTEPNQIVKPIHDRMPVILPRDEERTWLTADAAERYELCRPYPGDDLDAYPISTMVNDPDNDDARVIEPAETAQSDLDSFV
ncbi:MAG: SOS response-associated peptidase [Halobacteriales archaeon]